MADAKKLVEIIPGYLTTEQVAAITGYTVQRIRQVKDQLGGVNVPGMLYPVEAVREFAKRPRPKPGRKPAARG